MPHPQDGQSVHHLKLCGTLSNLVRTKGLKLQAKPDFMNPTICAEQISITSASIPDDSGPAVALLQLWPELLQTCHHRETRPASSFVIQGHPTIDHPSFTNHCEPCRILRPQPHPCPPGLTHTHQLIETDGSNPALGALRI